MGCKLRMMTCSENELPTAEFALCARGMQLVKYEEGKDLRPGKEYMKCPLSGFDTGFGIGKTWALIWSDEEGE